MKVCPKCNLTKSINEFYEGKNPYCKTCTSEYRKKRNQNKVMISNKIKDLTMLEILQTFPKEDLNLGLIGFIEKYSK